MGAEKRRTDTRLEELYQRGYRFGLFQAVRLLQRNQSDRPGLGAFGRPTQEMVRFSGRNSLVFPSTVVHSVAEMDSDLENSRDPAQAHLEISALGLAGYAGVLPAFYTQWLNQVQSPTKSNSALSSFLDLFNHRLLSLVYRSWERARPHIACERYGDSVAWNDFLSQHIFAMMGLGTASLRARSPVEPHRMIRYAGLLPYRSAASLEAILADYFGLKFEVGQFRGRWCKVNETDRVQLGSGDNDGRLGFGTMLGRVVWYPQASFRVRVQSLTRLATDFGYIIAAAPLSFKEFYGLLPGTAGLARLLGLINYFTREHFETFEVELTLRAEEIPRLQLAADVDAPARLGWTSWLGGRVDRKTVCVVFSTAETVTRVRTAVDSALRNLRASLARTRQLELGWGEPVVDQIMSAWKRSRLSAPAYSRVVTNDVMREITKGLEAAEAEKRVPKKATILTAQQTLLYRID